ncbi:MAG: BLUF domain-containing protein [Alphaproteobacteria bacterium]|nr:BLUF domain-containing protein [Alphaproteobacteria bacterium]
MLYSITYVSAAVRLFQRGELADLLEHGASNNRRRGITGLLLYIDGNFIQLIEGEKDVVSDLFEQIRLDPRHRTVITLTRGRIEQRHFANVSMGFIDGRRLPPSDRRAMLSLLDQTSIHPDVGKMLFQSFANTMAL